MIVRDIEEFFEGWTHKDIAWERDNVGLLVGDSQSNVRGVVVALDATEAVIEETRQRKANLLVTHHPLLFTPVRSLTSASSDGRSLQRLVRNNIHLFSAHTNLDFARGGTSFALAEVLGLRNADFLVKTYEVDVKVVTFVPESSADTTASAMAAAGAGRIGNYEQCSFRMHGTGTFKGNAMARPALGANQRMETVPEVRLEMVVKKRDLDRVLRAMKKVHPYEEVAYDVYPLRTISNDYGMGVIGELERPVKLSAFLSTVRRSLDAKALRYTGVPSKLVRRVAVCGGSGSDLVDAAIQHHADVFVTADVKYHSFHEATGRIALVDAGHFETEYPVVNTLVKRLRTFVKQQKMPVPVHAARTSANPVHVVAS